MPKLPKLPKPPSERRFPPPWSVVEVAEAYAVTDADGMRLCFTYFDAEQRGANSTRWTKPEALGIACAIALLPELIQGRGGDVAADFPLRAPWAAEDHGTWLTVTDAAGSLVAAVYVNDERAGSLSHDEARKIANGIAKLPDFLRKP